MKAVSLLSQFLRMLALPLVGASTLLSQTVLPPFVPATNSLFYPGTNAGASNGYYGEWQLKNLMPLIPGTNQGVVVINGVATNTKIDANVSVAWSNGYTGSGVIIGIVDDGVEGTQQDLDFANAYSWDFSQTQAQNLKNTNNNRGGPVILLTTTNFVNGIKKVVRADDHGTAVAGVAAAEGWSDIGVVGAAPDAQVASLRYLTRGRYAGKTEAQAQAAAILYEGQTGMNGKPNPYAPVKWNNPSWTNGVPVRIKNHSYGPSFGYASLSGFDAVTNALEVSSDHEVINVFSAGNQRPSSINDTNAYGTEDANKIEDLTDPNLITVAALGSDGKYASYSSYGANVFVTAPSGSSTGLYKIPTTDRSGTNGYNSQTQGPDRFFTTNSGSSADLLNYTSTFGGTSSAAPLVSGIMALGVQADTNMSLRLAQHLLALTSLQVDPTDISSGGRWITNTAGYKFDNNYGFGLVNATAFTTAAANVAAFDKANNTNALSPLQIYKGPKKVVNEVFASPKIKNGPLSNILNVNYDFKNSLPLPVEYVQIHITLSGFQTNLKAYQKGIGAIAGDLSGTLTSPSGTTDQLFTSDTNVIAKNRDYKLSTLSWTFLSYAYYGEQLNGPWTLNLVNNSTNTVYKTALKWSSFSITVGTGSFDTNAINPVTQSIIVTPTILGSLNAPQPLALAQPDTGYLPSSPSELTAVPEPSDKVLLLLGLGLGILFVRRFPRKV